MNTQPALRYLTPLAVLAIPFMAMAAEHETRVIQTNAAGDSVHIIDPATNRG